MQSLMRGQCEDLSGESFQILEIAFDDSVAEDECDRDFCSILDTVPSGMSTILYDIKVFRRPALLQRFSFYSFVEVNFPEAFVIVL